MTLFPLITPFMRHQKHLLTQGKPSSLNLERGTLCHPKSSCIADFLADIERNSVLTFKSSRSPFRGSMLDTDILPT
jgi:hypothetical protein